MNIARRVATRWLLSNAADSEIQAAVQNVREKMMRMVKADYGTSLYNRYKGGHLKAFNELKIALKVLIAEAQKSANPEDQKLAKRVSGYLGSLGIGRPVDPAGYHSALVAWQKARVAVRIANWYDWRPNDMTESKRSWMTGVIQDARLDVTVPIEPWGKAKVILYNGTRGASIEIEVLPSREAQIKRYKFGPMYMSIILDKDDIVKLFKAAEGSYADCKQALADVFLKYWIEYIQQIYPSYAKAVPRELDAEGYPIYVDGD